MKNRKFGVEFEVFNFNQEKFLFYLAKGGIKKVGHEYGGVYTLDGSRFRKWKEYPADHNAQGEIFELLDSMRGHEYYRVGYSSWMIKDDGSIEGPDSAEIVSPPLRGKDGFKQVQTVCQALAKSGVKVNNSCGLHVHLDASDLNRADLETILRRYSKWESKIDKFVHLSRRGGRTEYAQPVSYLLSSCVESRIDDIERTDHNWWRPPVAQSERRRKGLYETFLKELTNNEIKTLVTPGLRRKLLGRSNHLCNELFLNDDRYYHVNPQALQEHGTIEFRQHNGAYKLATVTNWIKFLLAFVDRSKEISKALVTKKKVADRSVFSGAPSGVKSFYKRREQLLWNADYQEYC